MRWERNIPMSERHADRSGVTLIEVLVVIGVIGILIGLVVPAVQKVRDASLLAECANNLKQIGLAVHQYHDDKRSLPPGMSYNGGADANLWSSWLTRILPYIERRAMWDNMQEAYRQCPNPFINPPHTGLATVVPVFVCPVDPSASDVQMASRDKILVALTSYLGVEGTSLQSLDGLLFRDSRVRFADVRDGLSETLLAGERPGSPDYQFGWWYAGTGQAKTGSADTFLGVRELNMVVSSSIACPAGPYDYGPGDTNNQCDMFHFWSLHSGGGQFVFADGSVHFLPYSAAPMLPALATRAGGDVSSFFE
jgi:prepilin-type N-terminal cleavage/methylation domain-containing protein/prepilin-type processing-associated H-X9-DG protein